MPIGHNLRCTPLAQYTQYPKNFIIFNTDNYRVKIISTKTTQTKLCLPNLNSFSWEKMF